MTTVAYRDGILAGDTQCTDAETGMIYPDRLPKVFKLPSGDLIGVAGDARQCTELVNALTSGKTPRRLRKVTALIVHPDRSLSYFEDGEMNDIGSPEYYAIGTGGPYALGALADGASAERAVRAATKCDSNSSEPIVAVELDK